MWGNPQLTAIEMWEDSMITRKDTHGKILMVFWGIRQFQTKPPALADTNHVQPFKLKSRDFANKHQCHQSPQLACGS